MQIACLGILRNDLAEHSGGAGPHGDGAAAQASGLVSRGFLYAPQRFGPDVVLLDLALGGWPNGFDVAREIRRLAGKQPVIVCVSGHGNAEHRRLASAAGCDYHLLKPADPEQLRGLLESIPTGPPP